jgi:hypothetical protein
MNFAVGDIEVRAPWGFSHDRSFDGAVCYFSNVFSEATDDLPVGQVAFERRNS